VGRPYTIDRPIDRTIEIQLGDQAEAERVFHQLRPWPNTNNHK
jgi:hypothetical protein